MTRALSSVRSAPNLSGLGEPARQTRDSASQGSPQAGVWSTNAPDRSWSDETGLLELLAKHYALAPHPEGRFWIAQDAAKTLSDEISKLEAGLRDGNKEAIKKSARNLEKLGAITREDRRGLYRGQAEDGATPSQSAQPDRSARQAIEMRLLGNQHRRSTSEEANSEMRSRRPGQESSQHTHAALPGREPQGARWCGLGKMFPPRRGAILAWLLGAVFIASGFNAILKIIRGAEVLKDPETDRTNAVLDLIKDVVAWPVVSLTAYLLRKDYSEKQERIRNNRAQDPEHV